MGMIENLLSAWWVWAVPVAFLAVLFYAFNPKRKKQFEEEARVPLEDDPPVK
jgi:cbb3-type cytochrome oxidase subunit 3